VTHRVVLLLLAALFVAFAAYGSLVPLRFREVGLSEAVEQFANTPLVSVSKASKSDVLVNVLLFVPIGFLLLGALAGRSRRASVLLALPVVLTGGVISVAIEFGQIFVVGRTPSWNDVLAESLGGALGALLWVIAGSVVVAWIDGIFRSEFERDRVYRSLGVYVGVWAILALLPLDFTVRVEELGEKFRAGRIVFEPFPKGWTLRDAGGTLLLAIPVGAFALALSRRRQLPRPALAGLGVGLALSVATEAVQFFSYSRTADSTDLLMNAAGIVLGVTLAARWSNSETSAPHASARVKVWPIVTLALWGVALLVRHWSPFDFTTDSSMIRNRIPAMFAVPFHSYYRGFAPYVLVDVTTKLLMAVPVGALLQLMFLPRRRVWRWVMSAGIVIVSGLMFLALELGQLMLPSRVPDQTDVYLGTLGATIGVALVWLITQRGPGSAATRPSG
jgi:glycopeptide antibiotics resistance protein